MRKSGLLSLMVIVSGSILAPAPAIAGWIGASSGTTNDALHKYTSADNWSMMDDSFNGFTFTGNTKLWFNVTRTTTASGVNLNYLGNYSLTFDDSGGNQWLNLNGSITGDYGGSTHAQTVTFETGMGLNLGSATRTLQIAAGDRLVLKSGVTGSQGLVKAGAGMLVFDGTPTYTGQTTVSGGTLRVNSTLASTPVQIDAAGTLDGCGSLSRITGAGRVSPGTSSGILTASQVDPGSGTRFAFEFTAPGDPNYASATASVNDVLHLTHSTIPFAGALDADNVVDVYLSASALADGDVFQGGFFSDLDSDFWTSVSGATFEYFVKGDGAGAHVFNGQSYYPLDEYNLQDAGHWTITPSTCEQTANFASGASAGWVTEFEVAATAPEPATIWLLAAGAAALGLVAWRRRFRAHRRYY